MEQEIQKELEQLQVIYDTIVNFFINYSFQLIGAVIVLLIGLMLASRFAKFVQRVCESKGIDVTLSRFIGNVSKIVIIAMVAVICLNKVGISITPIVAAIGAISLGAGLAVQGLLSNYSAGLNIIITRPFVVGDTISVQGVSGQVRDILLAYTLIVTEDDVEITIPNKHIVGEIIHNSHEVSLLELSIGVAYSSDLDKVTEILQNAVNNHQDVSTDKAPLVGISGFGDSSVDFEVRVWVDSKKLNASRFSVNKAIWDVLKSNSIDIPFPQREVKLLKDD
ncbi:mechanosensitive ion channel family protein [Pleionea sp. CnH1-48]|uniref:mechanosensitive ion channel family protein n=1 Tax=Pleionea sp. CnH1-48 TaxID=2954494 RepID=UPI0020981AEC|nr:mechanosensitive ion channel domain-containing protein [Pleionea sp. CnH1-48]MCO7224496.1 mechanosensitive ion channel [Pleionea sp. CnH1-48]